MATTYTLISSNVLTSSQASVTFSSIPATFTDLVLRASVRATNSGIGDLNLYLIINNDEGAVDTLYSRTTITGNGSSASSARVSNIAPFTSVGGVNGSTSTANTFASLEFYLPNYLVSATKVMSGFNVTENNDTEAYIRAHAGIYRSNTAITSVKLSQLTFAIGSSFYLYGISNA